MKSNSSRMISRQEAAEILRVDPQTVSNWCEKGVLRAKQVGKWMMVDRDTITALFDSLEDLAASKGAIDQLQKENNEKLHELRRIHDEWMLDVAMVNGLEKPSRLIRMIETMIDSVGDDIMSERERIVLKYYFDGSEFEAIGEEFGITRERTRQIIEKGMRKLGTLKPYGEVLAERDKMASDMQILAESCKRQEAELKDLRNKLHIEVERRTHMTADEKAIDELDEKDRQILELLNTRVRDMCISVRAINCLLSLDIETFGDMVSHCKTDLLKARNFGKKTLTELDDMLDVLSIQYGVELKFGMDVSPYYERYKKSIIKNMG